MKEKNITELAATSALIRKSFASFLIAGCGAIATLQWWQIAYRLRLFFTEYRGERGVNHVGDGDFALINITNALLLLAAVFAFRAIRQDRRWRVAAVTVGAVNVIGWLTLIVMHRTGALVEYHEFIRHWKGGR